MVAVHFVVAGGGLFSSGSPDGVETSVVLEPLRGVPHGEERNHGTDRNEGKEGDEEGGHGALSANRHESHGPNIQRDRRRGRF